ncbi:MAG: adenylate/guanylate cyclase domain-containing protein [Bacteroidota bacterium]|nr:adenylate/guanylate cyclase domain-containing protein [Bacteroidota bacterium]
MFKRNNKLLFILIVICIAVFILSFSTSLMAQENLLGEPKITNFKSHDYGYESQNYEALQAENGLMYFSNTNGILEYDNTNWNILRFTGVPHMDIGCSQQIFVGSYNQVGYLKNTRKGTEFVSIVENNDVDIPQIRTVVAFCGEVFFASDTCLFRYANEKLTCYQQFTNKIKVFKTKKQMYLWAGGEGLYKYENKQFKHISEADPFKHDGINSLCLFNNKLIIKPKRSKGLYEISNNNLTRIHTQVDSLLDESKVSKLVNYNNKYLLAATKINGIFIINKQGQLVFHLNKASGLADNHVTDMHFDIDNQLWVTTFNGISYIELTSPFTYYTSDERLNLSILAINKFKNTIYFSTNQGVYTAKTNLIQDTLNQNIDCAETIFRKVKNLNVRAKNLVRIEKYFYACTDYGIYLLHADSAQYLLGLNAETIKKSQFFQNQLYISCSDGLRIAQQMENGHLHVIGKIHNLDNPVRTIAEDINGNLWLGSNNDGVFRVEFLEAEQLDPVVIQIQKGYGLPENFDWIDVYNTRNGILFSTHQGVYRIKKAAEFVPDKMLGFDFSQSSRWIYPIHEDSSGNLWFSSGGKNKYKKQTGVALYQGKDKAYKQQLFPFQLISNKTIECIFTENNNVWLGSLSGIVRYQRDKALEKTKINHCIIRNININQDSVLLNNGLITHFMTQSISYTFNYKQKNIRFEYTAPFYQTSEDIKYQTRLLGLQQSWSDYNSETFKEFTNLGTGDYTFQVRAKNDYGQVTEISQFSFSINPPFYLSWIAFVFYFAIAVSLTYMLVNRRTYQHAKEKYRLEKIIASRTEELLKQKEQTERLVNRILPKTTIQEITEKGKASSKRYEMATVLFADIQGFTQIAEETRPEALIKMLDKIFKSFDEIIEKFDIEKIKTIGDAYMCAGGIPYQNSTNPIEVVLAALEMQQVVRQFSTEDKANFQIRIGIHTGPVISGVVGTQKLAYDIWGDTVNIASRMESHGEIFQVNISSTTYSHVKDFFECMYRGKTAFKNKGDMDMYFVKSILPKLAKDYNKLKPNHDFIVKIQLVRLQDLQNDIFEKLEKNLPKNLYYHNLKHTVNVYYQTEMLARNEGVSDEEMLLLKTAALMHDTGYLVSYDHHEEKGVELTQKTLHTYQYNKNQIDKICELIMATKMPPKPKNHMEEIICDADLDYLGRPDFIPMSQNLFRELFERNKIGTIEQWNKMQMKFMEKHRFFTATARKTREPEKQKRLAELKQML